MKKGPTVRSRALPASLREDHSAAASIPRPEDGPLSNTYSLPPSYVGVFARPSSQPTRGQRDSAQRTMP